MRYVCDNICKVAFLHRSYLLYIHVLQMMSVCCILRKNVACLNKAFALSCRKKDFPLTKTRNWKLMFPFSISPPPLLCLYKNMLFNDFDLCNSELFFFWWEFLFLFTVFFFQTNIMILFVEMPFFLLWLETTISLTCLLFT